ncbi:MAG: hypothetical protein ACMUHB_01240 [Thermoplasmatota archaeon]
MIRERQKNRFEPGLSFLDIFIYSMKVVSISYPVIFIMIGVPTGLVSIVTAGALESLLSGLVIIVAILGILVLTLPLMALMIAFRAAMQILLYRHRCTNFTKVYDDRIIVVTQRAWINPISKNRIMMDNIRKVEPANEVYFKQRWKRTPWYWKMNLLPVIPHGGLYHPYTSRRNLIILYLEEPVIISNADMRSYFHWALRLHNRPVLEVILDIDKAKHGDFMRTIEERW